MTTFGTRSFVRSFLRALALLFGCTSDVWFLINGNSGFHWLRRTQFRMRQFACSTPLRIGHAFYVRNDGNLSIGKRSSIGSFTKIWNYCPVTIGDDFIGAANLQINTATHDPATLENRGAPVVIGDRVWCGQGVSIHAGVTIGDDVIIGAGSLVIHNIPSCTIAAGVPAKPIRKLERDYILTQFGGQMIYTPESDTVQKPT